MAAHNDLAFVISADGRIKQESATTPAGHPATKSSFAGLLANSVRQTMGQP